MAKWRILFPTRSGVRRRRAVEYCKPQQRSPNGKHARHTGPGCCASRRLRQSSPAWRRDTSRSRFFAAALEGPLSHRHPPAPRGRCAPRARARADCQSVGTEISDPQLRARRCRDHLELRMCKRCRGSCPHIAAGRGSKKARLCCGNRQRRYRLDGRERVAPTMAVVEDYCLCEGAGRSADDLVQSCRTVRALWHIRGI